MWLNRQSVDAIQILLALAEVRPALLRASDIASRTGITPLNVQKTVHALGGTGLLEALRGRSGGVRLMRDPGSITLASIVRAFEPNDCPAGFLPWTTVDARISKVLFQAHRGFFQPLEEMTLGALMGDVRLHGQRPVGGSAAAGTASPPAASTSV
jgi:Rrf2 family nitric oxide-sensitive transcriptional repressor